MELCPGKGPQRKIVTLTDEGRALAERTVEPVIAAEERPSAPLALQAPRKCTVWRSGIWNAYGRSLKNCAVGAGYARPAA